jgi:hypothetical protein
VAGAPFLEWLLRSAVALVLLGRGVQHLFRQAPFEALIWNQELLAGAVQLLLGWDWQRWATSPAVVDLMRAATRLHGVLYLGAGVLALLPASSVRFRRAQALTLYVAATLLACLAALYCLDSKRQVGQALEFSLQCALPALLGLVLQRGGELGARAQVVLRLAIAGTFAGHGLYAIGFYEVPGDFVTLVMRCVPVGEALAKSLLQLVGALDFAIAFGVLAALRLPALDVPVLLYASVWGTLTALARVVAYFRWDMAFERLWQWCFETLLRLPHGLAPLFLLLLVSALRERRRAWS